MLLVFKSKIFRVFIIMLALMFVLVFLKRDVIFQEGNPIPLAVAITKLTFQDVEMVRVWQNPDQYIVKQGNYEPFIKYMEDDDWKYIGENGDGLLFVNKKGSVTSAIGVRSFTKYYTLIDSY
ncbi:hypothetical protein Q8G35_17200 [Peribacillus simplex]|uniref:Uncharacterized protein n=2 Tax=Peribacillus TaxID=2675229 RepID=A0AA90SML5_9BACI|nr:MULTISPECIES: hypothetical protein [Peribacillus]MDP1420083.1 hypothetical protein [Peribacillus simplex]MDP1454571.1 hypothetical protein [Peribacillus frigoritolerans]